MESGSGRSSPIISSEEEDAETHNQDKSPENAVPSNISPKAKKLKHARRPKSYKSNKLRRERCEKIRRFLEKQRLATGLSIAHVLNQSLSRREVIFGLFKAEYIAQLVSDIVALWGFVKLL